MKKCICNPAIFFAICSFWYFFEYYFIGPYSYLSIHDNADSHQARYIWLASEILNGNLPFNFPQYAGGVDILANGTRFFDVVAMYHLIFPYWFASTAIFISQFFFASYFTFKLASERLRLPVLSSLLAGLFAGFFQPNQLDFGLAFAQFPLILLVLEKITKNDYSKLIFQSVLLGVWLFFSSPVTIYIFILPCVLLWFLSVKHLNFIKLTLSLGISTSVLIMSQLQFISALLLNVANSHRANRFPDFDLQGSFSALLEWSLFLAPAAIIFLWAVVSKLKTRSVYSLFSISLNFALILVLASFSKPMQAKLPEALGFLRGFNFDHAIYILPFHAALIFGIALASVYDRVLVKKFSKKLRLSVIALFFLFFQSLTLKASNLTEWLIYGNYKTNFSNNQLQEFVDKYESPNGLFRFSTAKISGLENAVTLVGGETLGGYLNLYPETFNNFWAQLNAPFLSKDSDALRSLTMWGNKLYLDVGNSFAHAGFLLSDYIDFKFLSLSNVKYIISFIPLLDKDLKLVDEPKRARNWHLMSRKEKFFHNLRANFFGREFYIYENNNAFPRWYFIDGINYIKEDNIIGNILPTKTLAEMKAETWISSDYDRTQAFKQSNHKVSLVKYLSDEIVFKTTITSSNAFLVLLNSWNPFWTVSVNGKDAILEKPYDLFLGVKLKKGLNEVKFRYAPPYKF